MRAYANTCARALARHAVWEIGSRVDVGDFGIIQSGCFVKLGSVREFGVDGFSVTEAIDNRYELKALGAEKARAGVATDVLWAEGKLKVHWSGGNGLYVASPRARLRTLADLWSTATEIRQTFRAWKWAWKLVREVRYVEEAIVLLAQESAQATDFELNAPVHGAPTEASLEHEAAAGFALQRYPVTGALFVDLYRVRSLPFGLGATPAPDEDPTEPYPARADLPDDGPMEALCPPRRS